MIKKDNSSISSVLDTETLIGKIYKGIVKVYESWRKLMESGIPPLTLLKCKQANLVDYKVYGESVSGNIFNPNEASYVIGHFSRSNTKITTHDNARTLYVPCLPNTTYKAIRNIENSNFHFGYTEELPTVGTTVYGAVSADNTNTKELTITTGENAKYLVIYCYNGYVTTDNWNDIINSIQILQMPTPENPVEIESVGDKTRNLFDISKITNTNYITNNGDGSLTVTKYATLCNETFQQLCPSLKVGDIITYSSKCNGSANDYIHIDGLWDNSEGRRTKVVTQKMLDTRPSFYHVSGDFGKIWDIQFEYGENPTEYEHYGYEIPIKVSGKNLYDSNDVTNISTNSAYWGLDMRDWEEDYYTLQVKLKEDKEIPEGVYFGFIHLNTAAHWLVSNGSMNTNYNGIVSAHTSNILNGVCCYPKEKLSLMLDAFDIFLVKGKFNSNTIPNYEPYVEPITTNIYLKEPLRKIGDYKDRIDFEKGKVIRQIKEVVLDGVTASYDKKVGQVNLYPSNGLYYATLSRLGGINGASDVVRNTHFKTQLTVTEGFSYMTGYGGTYVMVHTNQELNTPDLWNAWLQEQYNAGTPVKVQYALATPDDTEDIELPNIPTHKGTTIIEVDTTITPSNMEVIYLGKK